MEKASELYNAAKTIHDFCHSVDDCVYCPFRRCGGECRLHTPSLWKLDDLSDENETARTSDDAPAAPMPSLTPAEKRKRILDDAIDRVCSDRNDRYGEPEDNFKLIAKLWTAYLNAALPDGAVKNALTPQNVADMMILLKIGRCATALTECRDTYVDVAGYAACAGGMMRDEQ